MTSKNNRESERSIEEYLASLCKQKGWLCLKYGNSQESGYPDRLIVTDDGRTAWAEIKRPGARPRPLQVERLRQLTILRQTACCLDCRPAAAWLVDYLTNTQHPPHDIDISQDQGYLTIYRTK